MQKMHVHVLTLKLSSIFVECVNDDEIIVFEDDVAFDFLPYVPFNWSEFKEMLPTDYEIVQLAVTFPTGNLSPEIVKITPASKYYCSTAYLVTRPAAIKLINRYYAPDGKIDLSNQEFVTADAMIAATDNTYSIPIFTYQITESIIHQNHLHLHRKSKAQQLVMWTMLNNIKT